MVFVLKHDPGGCFKIKMPYHHIYSLIKIKWSHEHFIFIMEIITPREMVFILKYYLGPFQYKDVITSGLIPIMNTRCLSISLESPCLERWSLYLNNTLVPASSRSYICAGYYMILIFFLFSFLCIS